MTVNVVVAEFDPRVTDVGDRLQPSRGDGPLTIHESCTALVNGPACGAIVIKSVTCVSCVPDCAARFAVSGVSEKSVRFTFPVIVTVDVADLLVSALLVATIVIGLPAVVRIGAL